MCPQNSCAETLTPKGTVSGDGGFQEVIKGHMRSEGGALIQEDLRLYKGETSEFSLHVHRGTNI